MTSINPPNNAIAQFAALSRDNSWQFLIIGDRKGPERYTLPGCQLITIDEQGDLDLKTALSCPEKSYSRKNIGYLLAIRDGVNRLYETDDDNIPCESFFIPQTSAHDHIDTVETSGPVNAYQYFVDAKIWPRGYPLSHINASFSDPPIPRKGPAKTPVWQGLAQLNPDVDAIYRLTSPLPVSFFDREPIALAPGSWCPFNSQNTTWFSEAFPLLYLPSYCSFRMTDIWRSFIAQRIFWQNDWKLLFHSATVFQERNEHNLLIDFKDEIPGYLQNETIIDLLGSLSLRDGADNIFDNMRICYETLVSHSIIGRDELRLLEHWISDFNHIRN
jgi:hypothetical protein